MRQTISGLLLAIGVMFASAAPASAWCGGVIEGVYAPCADAWQAYATPCGACFERLADPELQYHSAYVGTPQYYYINQGPTYTGPGNFAPYPYYEERGVTTWRAYRHRHAHHYGYRPVLRTLY